MRSLLSFLLVILLSTALYATDYFSQGSLVINFTNSWRDSGGNYPPNFTTANNRFIVQNGHSMTATAQWTVSGTNSYVVVQNGGKITTGLFNHQITGAVQNGGTYEVTNTSYTNLGWGGYGVLEPSSNFILNNAGINFIDTISYGNLTVQSGSADVRGSATGFDVKGELKVQGTGMFSGGLSEDQTLSIANINVTNGYFFGSEGAASVTYNISGNLSVSGGYFYGSQGSGNCNYNIGGNLINSGGFFYGVFRSSGTLPYNSYTIGGNFTVSTGNYSAINLSNGGYPSYYLTGTDKTCGFVSLPNGYQSTHTIYIQPGASYTMTNRIPIGLNMQLLDYGSLDASTFYIGPMAFCTIHIYGTLRTANIYGFAGSPSSTIPSTYSPTIDVGSNSTIDYYASADQLITARTDYRTVLLNGGTKNFGGNVTIATQLTNNADLNIASPYVLTLNGAMSSSVPFHGTGHLYIGGTSAQFQLPTCNITTITLNRPNGCQMVGGVEVINLNLTSGNWSISGTLILKGLIVTTSGSITGGEASNISIEGTAASLPIPATITTLNYLWLQRDNGCSLTGNLTLNNLHLYAGTFSVGFYHLSLHGYIDWGGGTLATTGNSQISVLSGSMDVTLPALTLGSLEMNRSDYSCYLTGNLNTGTVNLAAGNLSIGANTLTIGAGFIYTGGALIGGDTSNLIVSQGALLVDIPSVTLLSYTQRTANTVNVVGTMRVYNLSLVSGNLHIVETDFWLYQGFLAGAITPYTGIITGTLNSALHLLADNAIPWQIPDVDVGVLYCNLTHGCVMNGTAYAHNGLMLERGPVNPNGHLSVGAGGVIARNSGYLTAAPTLGTNLGIYYYESCSAGYELPAMEGYTDFILVAGNQVTVTVDHNVYLRQVINIMPQCVFEIQGSTLFCQPMCQFMGEGSLFGNVQINIGTHGLNAPPAGLKIEPGIQITGFNFTHLPNGQPLNAVQSINRTWTLYGEFSGTALVTFSWPISADNGLNFSPSNLARAYRWDLDYWQNVGNPVDVSMMVTRRIQVPTTEFSMWTVGTLAPLAVPFVMDFESGWKDCMLANGPFVNKWVTGVETAYRNTHAAYISALDNTYCYDITQYTFTHFYVDVRFPADMTDVRLRFEWQGIAEPGLDFLYIHLIDPQQIPMPGMPVTGDQLGGFYAGSAEWQLESLPLDPSYAGMTKRLVFTWFNNSSGGDQPPAAIDNIRIVTGAPPFDPPLSNIHRYSDTLIYIYCDPVTGANDYQYEAADTYDGVYTPIGRNASLIMYLTPDPLYKFYRIVAED